MRADALARRFSGDHEPPVPIGLASLVRCAFDGSDLAPVGSRLIERVTADAQDAAAMMDLSTILLLLGDRNSGMAWQARALDVQRVYRRPPSFVSPDGVRVLAFLAPGDFMANTPLEFLLEDTDVRIDMHYVVPGSPLAETTRDHDIAFVAAGGSEENHAVLRQIEDSVRSWPCPVLNRPERIASLSQKDVRVRLESVSGLVGPITAGSADYRGADGLFRKYRIALVDGRPYACQMAISDRPIVHHHDAGMRESAEKRAEEARFFMDFDEGFAGLHAGALRALCEHLGLDYFAIDCAETSDGKLLLLDIDVAMIVHSMDPPQLFPHRPAQMRRVRDAFRAMLRRTCGRPAA